MQASQALALRVIATAILVFSSGCGSDDDDFFAPFNAAPTVSQVSVMDTRVSPARIQFTLADPESDPADVTLLFFTPGMATPQALTLTGTTSISQLDTTDTGMLHERMWDFDSDLGSTFQEGFEVRVDVVDGVQSILSSASVTNVMLGNDAPMVREFTSLPTDPSGAQEVVFDVADSSDDLVNVRVEFEIVGTQAGFESFQTATPVGGLPASGFAFENVPAPRDGTLLTFAWDTDTDLGSGDFEVRLRVTAVDDLVDGFGLISGSFEVDNNVSPTAFVNELPFLNNPDARRGIPLRFQVSDPESDPVDFLLQWRRAGGTFPELPTSSAELLLAAANPKTRQALQLAAEIPVAFGGQIQLLEPSEDPDGRKLRLPELLSSASALNQLGLVGRELEILRPTVPEPGGLAWEFGVPVDAIAAGPNSALVLENLSGAWELGEFDLSTGKELRQIATGATGDPIALAPDPAGGAVLVLVDNGSNWFLFRVVTEGATSGTQTLISPLGLPVAGRARALLPLHRGASLVSVGTSLLQLDYAEGTDKRGRVLFDDFITPWGLASDPVRPDVVYVAERGNLASALSFGALFEVDLLRRTRVELPTSGISMPRPRAMHRVGGRLIVSTDANPLDGSVELRALELGSGQPPQVLASGLSDLGGIAGGQAGLLLATIPAGDLLLGGGVAQRRRIASFDASTQVVEVEESFEPALEGAPFWRVRSSETALIADPKGTPGRFVWDSSDVRGGGDVVLRGIPLDGDPGIGIETQTPRTLRDSLDVLPRELGGEELTLEPSALATADFNGDGRLDLVSANVGGNDLRLFLQSAGGEFQVGNRVDLGDGALVDDVQVADLNGDDLPDLVAGQNQLGDVRIYLQTTTGPMGPDFGQLPIRLGGGGTTDGPHRVALGDLNGDGGTDVASANSGSQNLTLFFQGNPGVFPALPSVDLDNAPDQPQAIDLGDFNNDGELDLLLTVRGADELRIYLQQLPGEFGPSADMTMGGGNSTFQPSDTVAFDADRDGDLDVVTALEGANMLALFIQDVPGFFPLTPTSVFGSEVSTGGPKFLAVADIDADGLVDLISANQVGDNLAVFNGRPSGDFGPEPELLLGSSSLTKEPRALAVADFDGDGDADLVSANAGSDKLAFFARASAGDFGPGSRELLSNPLLAESPNAVISADLNGDGNLDLALANREESHVSLYFQTTDGVFDPQPGGPIGQGMLSGVTGVAAGDLDQDGLVDLVAAATGASVILPFYQTEPGIFAADPFGPLGGKARTTRPRDVILGDMDGDGDLDILSANTGRCTIALFRRRDDGSYPKTTTHVFGGKLISREPAALAAAELDGDGDLDVVSANRGLKANGVGSGVSVFLQSSPAFFPTVHDQFLRGSTTTSAPMDVALADLNGDGLVDIATAHRSGAELTLHFQEQAGSFLNEPSVVLEREMSFEEFRPIFAPSGIVIGDINGDGQVDVMASDTGSSSVLRFLGNGSGDFLLDSRGPLLSPVPSSVLVGLAAADLDADGDLDLITADSLGGAIGVFFGGR